MKIKSVEIVDTPDTVQYELVPKNRDYRSIITEGSVLEFDDNAKEQIAELFDKPVADLPD